MNDKSFKKKQKITQSRLRNTGPKYNKFNMFNMNI